MNHLSSRAPEKSKQLPSANFPFRYSAIALALASITMLASSPSYAADDKSVTDLQAEVARVSAENARLKQELEASKSGAASAVPAEPAASTAAAAATTAAQTAAPVPAATKEDEPLALEAVVVRSRDRIESLQDVPVSESVVSGKELSNLGATDIGSITQRAGNVSWNYGNQRTSSLSIRGIGKQGQTEAQDPGVGLIVDGVSYAYNALSSAYDFTDVDTVEVARGPQGTLLGKNSSYGSVIVNSVAPSFTPSSSFSLTYGQLDTVKVTGAVGGAIVDDVLAWRGSFSASKQDGQLASVTNQDNTYTNTNRLSGRAQFLLTPSANFSALVAVNVTPNSGEFTNQDQINTYLPATYSNGQTTAGITGDIFGRLSRGWFTQNANFNPSSVMNSNTIPALNGRPLVTGSNGGSVKLNWNLSGGYTVTSITAYEGYYFDAVNDSGIPFDVWRNSGGFQNEYTQASQEFRLSSPVGGFVDYQTGLYVINVENRNDYQKAWGNDAGAYLASNAQYAALTAIDPRTLNNASGLALLQNSLSGLSMNSNSPAGLQDIRNKSDAIYGQANWHFTEDTTLTTGIRFTKEDRQNTASTGIVNNGNGAALNPVSVNGVQLGGFSSDSKTGALTGAALVAGSAQNNLANAVALQYFGVANYTSLSAAEQAQIANAKALRAAQIGVVFNQANATPFQQTLPSFVVSPSYKINEHATTYVSAQFGEKSGVAQFTNGISNPVKAEQTTSYEVGLKTKLLDDKLVFNTDAFLMDVRDYQQTTSVYDAYTTQLQNNGSLAYTSATGNVPWVRAQGVEIDGIFSGIPRTSIRFAGAYNNAYYKDFTNSAQPIENQYTGAAPYRDISGQTLPGASKWTGNIGFDYRQPISGTDVFHIDFNTIYRSAYNSDVALSAYAWVGASTSTDFAIGVGKKNKSFDTSILVKNLFNNQAVLGQTWNTYNPAVPRWIGVMFTAKN
jgi:outer membrane receptor protein involved in Fe transport